MKGLTNIITLLMILLGIIGCNIPKYQLKKADVLDSPCGERIYTISQKLKVLPDTTFNGNPIYVYDHKYREDTGRMLELQFFSIYIERLGQEEPNPCYERLTQKDIRKLLGKPTIIKKDGSYQYLMHFDKRCDLGVPGEKYCYFIQCNFEKNGILTGIHPSRYLNFHLEPYMFSP